MDSNPGRVKPNAIKQIFAKHTTLLSKSRDWLARNHDNVFRRSDMSECCYSELHNKNPKLNILSCRSRFVIAVILKALLIRKGLVTSLRRSGIFAFHFISTCK